MKEIRINVYPSKEEIGTDIISRVRCNSNLDYFNGEISLNGEPGEHKGLTKLKTGEFVILLSFDTSLNKKNYGYIVSPLEALEEIKKSKNIGLLKTKKFKELKNLE